MASGTIYPPATIVTASSPTVEQLKTARIIIARVSLTGTSSNVQIVDAIGDGSYSVSNNDRGGSYVTAYIIWNKANGTLTCNAGGTINSVTMIF